MQSSEGQKNRETHVALVHFRFNFLPLTMSQYEPEGSDVVKVAFHEPPALLSATCPTVPLRQNIRDVSDSRLLLRVLGA